MRNKILHIFVLVLNSLSGNAQNEVNKYYYKDVSLSKKATKENARFCQTYSTEAGERRTMEVRKLSDDKIVRWEEFKGKEPVGLWYYGFRRGIVPLDYEFELNYVGEQCIDSIVGISGPGYFEDHPKLGYVAPKLENEGRDFSDFIARNLIFPRSMIRNGIEGAVVINLTVTAEGKVENIYISKPSIDVSMDKEAQRIIRLLKFSEGAKLNGKPTSFCMSWKVRFEFR